MLHFTTLLAMKQAIILGAFAALVSSCGYQEFQVPAASITLVSSNEDSSVYQVRWTTDPDTFFNDITPSIERSTTILQAPKTVARFDGHEKEHWVGYQYHCVIYWGDFPDRQYDECGECALSALRSVLHDLNDGDLELIQKEMHCTVYEAVILLVEEKYAHWGGDVGEL